MFHVYICYLLEFLATFATFFGFHGYTKEIIYHQRLDLKSNK